MQVQECRFENNVAAGGARVTGGGALRLLNTRAVVEDTLFVGNRILMGGDGGGLAYAIGVPTLSWAARSGLREYEWGPYELLVRNTTFDTNYGFSAAMVARTDSLAGHVIDCRLRIEGCTVQHNRAFRQVKPTESPRGPPSSSALRLKPPASGAARETSRSCAHPRTPRRARA